MTATLNGIPALSVKLVIPWRGVWHAEVELDAPDSTAAQLLADSAIPAVLVVGASILTGTIDPSGSGTFSSKTTVRVIGGRGGWGKMLPGKDFTGPGGTLLSSVVFAACGLEAGEVVVDPVPSALGAKFSRVAGPARQIFGERDWHVDPITGVTLVAGWPSIPTTETVLDFHPYELKARLAPDGIIFPGAVLVDPRFNGATYIVADVEQTFDAHGSSAEVFCATDGGSASRMQAAFSGLVKAFGGVRYLRTYRYRFAAPIGNQAMLQAVSADAPDLNPIDQWAGLSGLTEVLLPGTDVMVGFAEGDPRYPYIVAYSPDAVPLNVNLTASVAIGLTAPAIAFLGPATFGPPGTSFPLAFGNWAVALNAALGAFAVSCGAAATVPQVAAAAAALASDLSALPPAATLLMRGN